MLDGHRSCQLEGAPVYTGHQCCAMLRSTLGIRGTTMHCADVFTALCIVRRQQHNSCIWSNSGSIQSTSATIKKFFLFDKYMEIQTNSTFAGFMVKLGGVLCGDVVCGTTVWDVW